MKYKEEYKTTSYLIILASFVLKNALCKPVQEEAMKTLLNSHYDNLQQAKQFIGSSVIGGLMWPVLLTLTVTAIMARVPDVLQRLLTGTGGNYRLNYLNRRSTEKDAHLDRIMKSLLTSLVTVEKLKLE